MGRQNNKFKISTDARNVLLTNAEFSASVDNRIYPCVAPEGTDQDYVVYYRDAYGIDKTKQGIFSQEATVMFAVVSTDYDRSQDIADKLFNALQGTHGTTTYNLEDSTEDYIDKKFIQFLLFKII